VSYIQPDIVEEVRKMDLLTYLKNYEPHELVRVTNHVFSTKTHDSLKISNGKWYWWSRGIGGKSALDYLIKVKGYDFQDAVRMIANSTEIKAPVIFDSVSDTKRRGFSLPAKNSNNNRIIKYLMGRGIDREIIQSCIKSGLLYESYPHHNAVFVSFDDSVPKYAFYRSTGNNRFIGEVSGSDKRYSFRILNTTSPTVHIFEGAIDLLSYASLIKMNDRQWKDYNLLSLGGIFQSKSKSIETDYVLPKALEHLLHTSGNLKNIILHLDNDEAGKTATKAISTALMDKYTISNEPPPAGKDLNDYLRIKQSKTRKKEFIR